MCTCWNSRHIMFMAIRIHIHAWFATLICQSLKVFFSLLLDPQEIHVSTVCLMFLYHCRQKSLVVTLALVGCIMREFELQTQLTSVSCCNVQFSVTMASTAFSVGRPLTVLVDQTWGKSDKSYVYKGITVHYFPSEYPACCCAHW